MQKSLVEYLTNAFAILYSYLLVQRRKVQFSNELKEITSNEIEFKITFYELKMYK